MFVCGGKDEIKRRKYERYSRLIVCSVLLLVLACGSVQAAYDQCAGGLWHDPRGRSLIPALSMVTGVG